MSVEQLAAAVEGLGALKRGEILSRHTTFGVGGPADLFLTVRDAEGLRRAWQAATNAGVPAFILGSGSNILVADAGIRGLVIDNRARAEQASSDGLTYRVESGTSFAAFSRRVSRQGKAGMTWAVGIPGTAGGAVVYNAGAYGGCLADILVAVHLSDASGTAEWVDASALDLAYRESAFTRGQFAGKAVLGIELRLTPGDANALMATAVAHDTKRLGAQPRGRNAGSMFKNPASHQAWQLVDSVGLRGARRGDAAISDMHCNFFVNEGNARAADVAWLVEEAERRVREQHGIQLVREVAFVGAW
ncbi:MAG: UDP-N-acetylmuramate dehydrogenase [Dehalococcoidia bacterium]